MNPDDNKIVLAFLGLIVIASGCAHTASNSDQSSGDSPIQINSLSIFPNPAPANQTVTLEIEVENIGDVDAEGVYYRIFNPPFASERGQDRAWRDGDGAPMNSQDKRTFPINDVLRAPTDTNPSIPMTDTRKMTAPNLEQGRTVSYDFFSRLFYNYSTRANADIQIMSSERYREQGIQRSQPELENTQGPVQLDVRTSTPLVIYPGDSDGENPSTEVCVIVRNTGQGQPYWGHGQNPPNSEEVMGKVDLSVKDVGNVNFTSTETNSNSVTAEIVGNRAVECFDMEVQTTSQAEIQQTITLELEADYGYQEETQTSVTVEGRR